jgi:flagellar basal-body rod modification protein FlgD
VTVNAIGGTLNTQVSGATSNNTINQDAFIKLFLTQLQFQDPLQPLDNSQFLAQLAEFSNLQQSQQISQNTNDQLAIDATTQAVGLLNHKVTVQGQDASLPPLIGDVTAIAFTTAGAQLTITDANGQVSTGILLSQVSLVQP